MHSEAFWRCLCNTYSMLTTITLGLELWDKVLPVAKLIIEMTEEILSIIASVISIIQFIKNKR